MADGPAYNDGEALPATDLTSMMPVNSVIWLHKSAPTISSGTADGNTVDKLIDSGATFQTDGVEANMYVRNTTDSTWGVVSSVDSETQITMKADTVSGSSTTDVFPDGNENYEIYGAKTPSDAWAEANGQTISDADSFWNSSAVPNWNGDNRFVRSNDTSGGTGGSETHQHQFNPHDWTRNDPTGGGAGASSYGSDNQIETTDQVAATSTLPTYVELVAFIRIK